MCHAHARALVHVTCLAGPPNAERRTRLRRTRIKCRRPSAQMLCTNAPPNALPNAVHDERAPNVALNALA
eukprot:11174254-Lingulodinium_polyedra.AAC.1